MIPYSFVFDVLLVRFIDGQLKHDDIVLVRVGCRIQFL